MKLILKAGGRATGFDGFRRHLAQSMQQAVSGACSAVRRDARAACPVDTGRLRNSIHAVIGTAGECATGQVRTEVDYAPIVHEGWGNLKAPHPFLEQAAEAERTRFPGRFRGLTGGDAHEERD